MTAECKRACVSTSRESGERLTAHISVCCLPRAVSQTLIWDFCATRTEDRVLGSNIVRGTKPGLKEKEGAGQEKARRLGEGEGENASRQS